MARLGSGSRKQFELPESNDRFWPNAEVRRSPRPPEPWTSVPDPSESLSVLPSMAENLRYAAIDAFDP